MSSSVQLRSIKALALRPSRRGVEMLQLREIAILITIAVFAREGAPRMPLETQEDYLNHLYLQVKNRPLRDGELNLLADEDPVGFANTVRCIPESEEGNVEQTDTSIKMEFESAEVKSTEKLIAVKVVINLPPQFSQDGEVTLYETSPDDLEYRKQLDQATMPSCHTTCWFELTVGLEDLKDNMEFQMEFTHADSHFVQFLNPMMVLYTYMEQPLSTLVERRQILTHHNHESTVRSPDQPAPQEHTNVPLSELDSQNNPCGKHTVRLQYSQLKFLDDDAITLISPPYVEFDYCYGHCNTPLEFLPLDDPTEGFDKRARILEVMNRLSENRRTPPPCCVPLTYIAREIIYSTGGQVAMTTIPSVQACGCRA